MLASPLGFLIGVSLGALGGGGSILAVPVLVFVAGQSPSRATSTSLVVVGVAALIGAVGHWRAGRVRVGIGLVFGFVGVAGSLAGTALNRRLDGDVLLLAFAGLILVAAWRMFATESPADEDATEGKNRTESGEWTATAVIKLAVAGTGVGFLTGLFGVGGGFVIVPVLALVLGLPMPVAVGTSLLVIAVNTAVALAARAGGGSIEWATTAVFTVAAVLGVGAGKRIADGLDGPTMRRAFAALLVVVAMYTGAQALVALT
ncbi:MAG: sulfite exporter TauE/SafE family protein [Acidimicrobiales bacterium]